ncbi:dihydrolipoyl dehydrogenase [Desulfomarina sp.]
MVMGDMQLETELLILGSGPGGYGAAFRAADLGLEVTVADPNPAPGGACLHHGCIPSKTFLYLAGLIHDTERAREMGVHFGPAEIDIAALSAWKDKTINELAESLQALFSRRNIELIHGNAVFTDSRSVRLQGGGISKITFQHAIIATGSRPASFPAVDFDSSSRVLSSTEALQLEDIPGRLLVIGGGVAGLELGSIYSSFGSRVSLVEKGEKLLPPVDQDLVEPLYSSLSNKFDTLATNTEVTQIHAHEEYVEVELETAGIKTKEKFDKIIVTTGRTASSDRLGLENTAVKLDSTGFIETDDTLRTSEKNIFAVGDVTGLPMLAHRAIRQGQTAAEVIAGLPSAYDIRATPAIIYTDPQIAWCGLTELEARERSQPCTVQKFPWKYSDRARSMGRTNGLTKLLTDPDSGRILGMGIVGREAENLIAEAVLAIEMGALAEDLALTLHPYPSLSETEAEAAELFSGASTHFHPGKTPGLPGS